MSKLNLLDILPLIEKPSRYLGSEINTIRKDPNKVKLRFALVFPDLYEIGTSHFGMQILYHILNSHPEIAAERVFAPGIDLEQYLRRAKMPLFTLESRAPLAQFHIIGFSLLYELNYTNILTILDLAGIPFRAEQRSDSDPLIIAGGPCACNPEPIAEFFDAIVVGDGEQVIMDLSSSWLQWRQNVRAAKFELLKQWAKFEGVYIPSFFECRKDQDGFQILLPRFPEYSLVRRCIAGDLNLIPFPQKPIVPYGKPVHDRLRIEVSRGCTRGCRFCQAGMIYRPVRERSAQRLISMVAESIAATGYEDISLLSLSTGDYSCIIPLMERLMGRFAAEHIAVSMPSLRVGTLTTDLMELIKKVRKTGFTIAPEAGSQRLRDVVNKNISESEILATVKNAFHLGWQVIKLYFMIGLPTETLDDLHALVDLVKRLRAIKVSGRRKGKINVSVATFIPKAHTPFQWASQITLAESIEKINWLKHQLTIPGVHFKWQHPEISFLEGIWARGDRQLNQLLTFAYRKGCKLDGWSDTFKFQLWQEAFVEAGVDPDFYTVRKRDMKEPLPWDHIDSRVSKEFLTNEWHNAMQAKITADCRKAHCSECGVCDFKIIEPIICHEDDPQGPEPSAQKNSSKAVYKKLTISFSKCGEAKYFGHLELVNIFLRAIRRAEIPVQFSEGFHPKPKVSFVDALPVGIESQKEFVTLTVPQHIDPRWVVNRLNVHMPGGLRVYSEEKELLPVGKKTAATDTYQVILREAEFDPLELESFIQSTSFTIERMNQKGKLKKIDLKDMVVSIELIDSKKLQVTLKSEPGKTIRPLHVLACIFSVPGDEIKKADFLKLRL